MLLSLFVGKNLSQGMIISVELATERTCENAGHNSCKQSSCTLAILSNFRSYILKSSLGYTWRKKLTKTRWKSSTYLSAKALAFLNFSHFARTITCSSTKKCWRRRTWSCNSTNLQILFHKSAPCHLWTNPR